MPVFAFFWCGEAIHGKTYNEADSPVEKVHHNTMNIRLIVLVILAVALFRLSLEQPLQLLRLPPCGTESIRGEWFHSPDRSMERDGPSEKCCGWDTTDRGRHDQNTPGCRVDNKTAVPWVVGGRGCRCKGGEDQYVFVPDTCHLFQWDARKFCKLIKDHQLLFVGDSVTHQMFAVLVAMVHKTAPWCVDRLKFEHSDSLDGNYYGASNRGPPLSKFIRRYMEEASVQNRTLLVVASAGAHLVIPEAHQAVAVYHGILNSTLSLLRQNRVEFVWLTPPPGHPRCQGATKPESADYTMDKYHWKNFHWFALEAPRVLGPKRVIDVYQALLGRQDGHNTVECLHYCFIGPMEIVPRLLYHRLLTVPALLAHR